MNKDYYFKRMIGNKMIDIGRAADMIWITLGDVSVDLQVETAIWLDGQLLTQMEDIYEETGLQDERWNRPQTLFDVKITELLHLHREFFVSDITTDDDLNMEINFTGGLSIKLYLINIVVQRMKNGVFL